VLKVLGGVPFDVHLFFSSTDDPENVGRAWDWRLLHSLAFRAAALRFRSPEVTIEVALDGAYRQKALDDLGEEVTSSRALRDRPKTSKLILRLADRDEPCLVAADYVIGVVRDAMACGTGSLDGEVVLRARAASRRSRCASSTPTILPELSAIAGRRSRARCSASASGAEAPHGAHAGGATAPLQRRIGLDTLDVRLRMHKLNARMQSCMQYTVRDIPRDVDAALRKRAQRERKTLNQAAVEAMAEGLGLEREPRPRRSVRDIVGALAKDPKLEAALDDQRRVEPELWR
jgi:hypothetical protein